MMISIILGLGVPPSVSYIVQIAVTIPVVIGFLKADGLPPEVALIVAHFFVMYYASLAVLTPPDALASIAAAGIAKSPVMKTAMYATRVAFVAFIVPFLFAYKPTLLLQGPINLILIDVGLAIIAVIFGSIALEAYRISWVSHSLRALSALVAIGCAWPDHLINAAAFGLALIIGLLIWRGSQKILI